MLRTLNALAIVMSSALPAVAGEWVALGSPEGGRVRFLSMSSTVRGLAFVEAGQLARSTDGGLTWVSALDDPSDPEELMYDPFDGTHIFLRGRSSLFVTRNGGINWSPIPWQQGPPLDLAFDTNLPGVVYLLEETPSNRFVLLRSDDNGSRWTPVHDFGFSPIHSVVVPTGSSTVLVGSDVGIRRSTDGGQSFTRVHLGPRTDHLVRNPNRDGRVAAVMGDRIISTWDDGLTWQERYLPIPADEVLALDLAGNPLERMLVTGWDNEPRVSPDDGQSWRTLEGLPEGFHTPYGAISPFDSRTYLVGEARARGVWRSPDGGRTWSESNTGLSIDLSVLHLSPSSTAPAYAFALDELFVSRDLGATWEHLPARPANAVIREFAVHPTNPDIMLALSHPWDGPPWILRHSRDGGQRWSEIDWPLTQSFAPTLTVDAGGAYVIVDRYEQVVSTDRGRSWQQGTLLGDYLLRPDPFRPGRIYAYSWFAPNSVYRSADSGLSWLHLTVEGEVKDMAFDARNSGRLIAVGEPLLSVGVFRSFNGGRSWREQEPETGLPVAHYLEVAVDAANPDRIALGSYDPDGLFLSVDGGRSFTDVQAGAEPSPLRRVEFHQGDGRLWAIGSGVLHAYQE